MGRHGEVFGDKMRMGRSGDVMGIYGGMKTMKHMEIHVSTIVT